MNLHHRSFHLLLVVGPPFIVVTILINAYIIAFKLFPVGRRTLNVTSATGLVVSGFEMKPYDVAVTAATNADVSTKYVSLCWERLHGYHRTGNQLFMLATMLYVAHLTGRKVAMPKRGWSLDDVFNLTAVRDDGGGDDIIVRTDELDQPDAPPGCRSPRRCRRVDSSSFYGADEKFASRAALEELTRTEDHLLLCGLYQTYAYATAVENQLRRLLVFRAEIRAAAEKFLLDCRPTNWNGDRNGAYYRVGVHIRRGDFLVAEEIVHGLTVVDGVYLRHAFDYFRRRYARLQFIVATQDWRWTRANLPPTLPRSADEVVDDDDGNSSRSSSSSTTPTPPTVVVTYSRNHCTGVDLAILAACDAVVVSTGTFGWWAAWLAAGPTIYYADWPRNRSRFARELNRTGYFPPHWIPML